MKERKQIKAVAKTDNMEILSKIGPYGDEAVVYHSFKCLDERARMAVAFAERWAMVAVEIDGEDTAGRQKVRRLSPGELAQEACEAVSALYHQFGERGWTVNVPSYESMFKEEKPSDE